MKTLLTIVMILLCFVGKAQSRDTLMKLYYKFQRIDKVYHDYLQKKFRETGPNWKEKSEADYEKERIKDSTLQTEWEMANGNYNDYWFRYHEMKGDLQQKLHPEYYGNTK